MKRTKGALSRPADIESYENLTPKKIPCNQFGLDGKYIQTYESMYRASKATKTSYIGITLCCRGKKKSSNHFMWKKA
jgi:hypothetical protein